MALASIFPSLNRLKFKHGRYPILITQKPNKEPPGGQFLPAVIHSAYLEALTRETMISAQVSTPTVLLFRQIS